MSGGHYIRKCTCGAVLDQCRCADPNKQVIVVKNGCPECQRKAAAKAPAVKRSAR